MFDIASDPFVKDAIVVLLTETQVLHNHDGYSIQDCFESNELVMHNNPIDRFKSLAFFKKSMYHIV